MSWWSKLQFAYWRSWPRLPWFGARCLCGRDVDPAPHHLPRPRVAAACVVGEGAVAREAVRRLVSFGAESHPHCGNGRRTHCCAWRRRTSPPAGGPGRLDAAAGHRRLHGPIELHRRALDRTPSRRGLDEDFAGPPGSVDFETAKRLGHEVIWARKYASAETEANLWTMIRARVEAIAMTRRAL